MRTTTIISSLALAIVAASCGGKSKTTVANSGGGGSPVPAGIHACQFIVGGDSYGPHRCDVAAGTIDKVSGMELFSATFAAQGDTLAVRGAMGCGAMAAQCDQQFTATLKNEGGTWRGPVTATGAAGDWWLAGSTFELTDAAGYGGATYGAAWGEGEHEGD